MYSKCFARFYCFDLDSAPMKISLLTITLLLNFTASAEISEKIAELCASGKVEGHYRPATISMGKVDLYLLCIGDSRIVASVGWGDKPRLYDTLVFNAVDGDVLTLSDFKLDFEEGGGLPASGQAYKRLQLSISALKNSELKGRFRAVRIVRSVPVVAVREESFPDAMALADTSRDYGREIVGLYQLDQKVRGLNFGMPTVIDVDVLGNQQRLALIDGRNESLTMYMGMVHNNHNVFYAGSGLRNAAMPFIHVRGRLIDQDKIEFYYFSTMSGMSGPYTATRTDAVLPRRKL